MQQLESGENNFESISQVCLIKHIIMFSIFSYSVSSTWIFHSHIFQLDVSLCWRMVYTHIQYSTNCLSHPKVNSFAWCIMNDQTNVLTHDFFRYLNRPVMSGVGLYDPTNIMNQDVLNKCQREGWIKLAFYLLSFFFYLYGYNRLVDYVLKLILLLIFFLFTSGWFVPSFLHDWSQVKAHSLNFISLLSLLVSV